MIARSVYVFYNSFQKEIIYSTIHGARELTTFYELRIVRAGRKLDGSLIRTELVNKTGHHDA